MKQLPYMPALIEMMVRFTVVPHQTKGTEIVLMNTHTLNSFDTQLDQLRSIISRMGGLAESQLDASMLALQEFDIDKANEILANDKLIDTLEVEAEHTAVKLIATRAPVADDLRELIGALKISSMLERLGDFSKNNAKRVVDISENTSITMPETLVSMASIASRLIRDVIEAFVNRDEMRAKDVWEQDKVLDTLV